MAENSTRAQRDASRMTRAESREGVEEAQHRAPVEARRRRPRHADKETLARVRRESQESWLKEEKARGEVQKRRRREYC